EDAPSDAHVGGDVAERRSLVLDIVVQRAVDVREASRGERHQPEPVVVELLPLWLRKRQRDVEQLAAEQGGGAGHGVGDQQRREGGGGGAPLTPPHALR